MKTVLISGISLVNLALVAYSIAIILLLKTKVISKTMLRFLALGVVFDISATVCMIIGSGRGVITLHGMIGYLALAGMLADTVLSYVHVRKRGYDVAVSKGLFVGSLIAYVYWMAAYVTGAIIIMSRH